MLNHFAWEYKGKGRSATLEAAYAEFMEGRKGILKPGYLADLVIMEKDLLTLPAGEIMKDRVDCTIVGGKVVYRRDGVK
jgi:predicted amidohydrolase YtcJ